MTSYDVLRAATGLNHQHQNDRRVQVLGWPRISLTDSVSLLQKVKKKKKKKEREREIGPQIRNEWRMQGQTKSIVHVCGRHIGEQMSWCNTLSVGICPVEHLPYTQPFWGGSWRHLKGNQHIQWNRLVTRIFCYTYEQRLMLKAKSGWTQCFGFNTKGS